MTIILMKHTNPYFGQDFSSRYLIQKLGLVPVFQQNGCYILTDLDASNINLIVSRYPDNVADNEFILRYSKQIPVACHLHLWYHFLSSEQQALLVKSLMKSSLLIANCKALYDDYKLKFPALNWTYINNGVDSRNFTFSTEVERNRFKQKHHINRNRLVISFIGRLIMSKGFQILEHICAFVDKSDCFSLIIQTIFLPKHEGLYSKLARYRNVIIEFSQDENIHAFADVHINTSLCETTSLSIIESLFCGVPVVCTMSTPFYEELENVLTCFKYFHKVSIPGELMIKQLAKKELRLEEYKAKEAAYGIIRHLENFTRLEQAQREMLSVTFSHSKFESGLMLSNTKQAYQQITNEKLHIN